MTKFYGNPISRQDGLDVVTPPEEIDIVNADRVLFELMLAARTASIVVLDMSRTQFCDSSGFLRIAMAGDHLRAIGGDLRVVCGERMHMLMGINGDDEHVTVFARLIEALNARPGSAPELVPAA
jgi:anti-anti-sigma regulatory factor